MVMLAALFAAVWIREGQRNLAHRQVRSDAPAEAKKKLNDQQIVNDVADTMWRLNIHAVTSRTMPSVTMNGFFRPNLSAR